jgi:hypothetical protein
LEIVVARVVEVCLAAEHVTEPFKFELGGRLASERARIALGRQSVATDTLAAVDVDTTLCANAPGPRVATTDGVLINAGDDGEILSDGRPDDCDCWNADAGLPCWPCC